jgi:hypothetical protein
LKLTQVITSLGGASLFGCARVGAATPFVSRGCDLRALVSASRSQRAIRVSVVEGPRSRGASGPSLGAPRLLRYLRYYHGLRTHLALGKDAPEPRAVEPPEHGHVGAMPQVGGLHHRYIRRTA